MQLVGRRGDAAIGRKRRERAQLPDRNRAELFGHITQTLASTKIMKFLLFANPSQYAARTTPVSAGRIDAIDAEPPTTTPARHSQGERHERVGHGPRQGALQVRRDGIQEDGLLGARLRAEGHRRHRAVPGHAAGRRRSDRGVRGGGRRILHRDLDRGVDRPPDRLREVSRQVLSRRSGAEFARPVFRLHRLRSRSVRARLDRQPHRLDHRQRVRLQAVEGAAAGGHAAAGRLREDLPGPGHRHRGRARAARQVRPAAARRHRQAEARPLRPQLRPRGLRGAEGRPRLHQGRREHQLAALHALARPLPLLHGGGQQGAGRDRRDQGHLSQRHRRHDGGHVRARRVRQGARLGASS